MDTREVSPDPPARRDIEYDEVTRHPLPRILVTVLVVSLLLCGGACKKSPAAPQISDAIAILSVSPDQDVPPNVNVRFVVTVNYTLASRDSGVLMIGFNNGSSPTSYYLVMADTFLVTRGSGQHVFDATVMTKDWGTSGRFGVYVNLSAHPHPSPWTPLASKVHPVTLTPPPGPAVEGDVRSEGSEGSLASRRWVASYRAGVAREDLRPTR